MQRPVITPISKVKRTKLTHTVRAIGIGLAFCGLDYLGYIFHRSIKNFSQVNLIQDEQAGHTKKSIEELNSTRKDMKYSKDQLLKTIAERHGHREVLSQKDVELIYLDQSIEDKMIRTRLMENFIYGSIFVKLGKEIRNMFMNNTLTSWKMRNKLLLSYPVPIFSYYAFCNFYEGRSQEELRFRLQSDFILLYCIRIITATLERKAMFRFEKLVKSIQVSMQDPQKKMDSIQQQNIIKTAMKKVTFSRNVASGIWIFALTYLYKYPYYDSEPLI